MPKDPLIPREVHQGAIGGSFAKDYFERYPKDHFQTEWRHPQSANIEFTREAAAGVAMKLAAGVGASHV